MSFYKLKKTIYQNKPYLLVVLKQDKLIDFLNMVKTYTDFLIVFF